MPALAAMLFDTHFGACALAWSQRGAALRLLLPTRGEMRRHMSRAMAGHTLRWDAPPRALERAAQRIKAYLAGDGDTLQRIAIDLGEASAFHQEIFNCLRRLPSGQTISYGALATLAGHPGAARAVGSAMARNPLPLLVPCHRVLPASGALGDFSAPGGPRTKLRLLALEGLSLSLREERDQARADA